MEKYKYLFGSIFSFSILIVVLWISILVPTYDKGFYFRQYEKNNIYDAIHISKEDLYNVTTQIIRYLQLRTTQLNVDVEINSRVRPFYNEKELEHMADVQDLFQCYMTLAAVCVMVSVVIFLALRSVKDKLKVIAKCLRATFILFIITFALLAFIISTNFDRYFTIFHEIFFSNDLWILDPATDLLINIVPLPFFIAIAMYVAIIFTVLSALIILGSSVLLLHFAKR